MALITCPDCGRKVSDLAVACPDCARPIASLHEPPAVEEEKSRPLSRRDVPRPESPASLDTRPADLQSARCRECGEMMLGADPDDAGFICPECREEVPRAHAHLRRILMRRVMLGVVLFLVLLGIGWATYRLLTVQSVHDPVAPHD